MLTRVNKIVNNNSPLLLSTQQIISKRKFFDYLKTANEVDNGKSLEQLKEEKTKQKQEDVTKFNWNFIEWFEKHVPENAAQLKAKKQEYLRNEMYLTQSSELRANKTIDFNEYRRKIADPNFVDELEIEFNVHKNSLLSIKNMKTLNSWEPKAIEHFHQECSQSGDILMKPWDEAQENDYQQKLAEGKKKQQDIHKMYDEFFKTFEQVDAERLMYGHHTHAMKLSQHPQYAETLEDNQAAKQTYLDFVMADFHTADFKRERLHQIQDENRRKVFLERFDEGSKIIVGVDSK